MEVTDRSKYEWAPESGEKQNQKEEEKIPAQLGPPNHNNKTHKVSKPAKKDIKINNQERNSFQIKM